MWERFLAIHHASPNWNDGGHILSGHLLKQAEIDRVREIRNEKLNANLLG